MQHIFYNQFTRSRYHLSQNIWATFLHTSFTPLLNTTLQHTLCKCSVNPFSQQVRADGMQVSRLLTFAMYAPWVQITQVSAAKHTGNEIRGLVRKHREEEEQAQQKLHQRMKSELFGSPTVPQRISQVCSIPSYPMTLTNECVYGMIWQPLYCHFCFFNWWTDCIGQRWRDVRGEIFIAGGGRWDRGHCVRNEPWPSSPQWSKQVYQRDEQQLRQWIVDIG